MAVLYFMSQDGSMRLGLDSEEEIIVSLPSTVSKSSTSSGRSVGHGVIEENATISANGIVTYSKSLTTENLPNPKVLQEEVQKLRRSGQRFTVYTYDGGDPLLLDYPDCVIVDVQFTVSNKKNAINCSITFEQVFVSAAAKKAFLAPIPRPDSKGINGDPDDGGQGTKTTEKEEVVRETILLSGWNTITGGE